jgi:SNF2 family DNA or RNA helicase
MMDTSRKTIDRLIAAYNSLSPFEQTVLQLLSVLYEPVNRTAILNCMRRAKIKGPKDHWLILPTITPYLTKLKKMGLFDEEYRCHAALVEILSTEAVDNASFSIMARAVQDELPLSSYHGKREQRCQRLLRELRIAIYTNDIQQIENISPLLSSQCDIDTVSSSPIVNICTNPFQARWFRTLPASFQLYLLDQLVAHSVCNIEALDPVMRYLKNEEQHRLIPEKERLPFHRLLAQYLLWRGELTELRQLIEQYPKSFAASGVEPCVAFITGDNDRALQGFRADLELLHELNGKKTYFYNISGIFYILALLKDNDASRLDTILELIATVRSQQSDTMLLQIYTCLEAVILAQKNRVVEADGLLNKIVQSGHSITLLFTALSHYWVNGVVPDELIVTLTVSFEKARANGYMWLAFEYGELLCSINRENIHCDTAVKLRQATGFASIVNAAKMQEPWRRCLEALVCLTGADQELEESTDESRLAWMIGYDNRELTVSPKEQKLNATGTWSKGRPVALSRLYSGHRLDFLTEQDRRICTCIRRKQTSFSTTFTLDLDTALPAMIGHPLLFQEDSPRTPIEFVKGEPELLVEEDDQWIRISFINEIAPSGLTILRESQSRFRIIDVTERFRRIAKIITKEGLQIPVVERDQVLKAIGSIASYLTVHSAIGGIAPDIAELPATAGIYMQLLPHGSGFQLEMFVRPFAKGGPYLKPGQGAETIMAEINGQRLQTRRNLGLEEENARQVETACPTLGLYTAANRVWHVYDIDDCLQVLLELQDITDQVTVEWPEGEKLKVTHHSASDQLLLKIHTGRNWFAIDGQLQLDESLVLDMKKLLPLVKKSRKRFIPLGEGQFLALTNELHNRLQELNTLAGEINDDLDEPIRIHPLATLALENITSSMGRIDGDFGWHEQLRLIEQARNLQPEVPSTLETRLRDYQIAGFEWLTRLAHWGLGACLADDMGLGKTIQALAIILTRAPDGPTLVVAPTSVCLNWQDETSHFAPSLTIRSLDNRDRQAVINGLGKNDLLITSYTLLQQETELLASVEWQTIVLDEAQAIKNTATKRSRAAMALSGKFKLLTTGTPIENHLGELWNLFHFITPGLLGSLKEFNERFAVPIERQQSQTARKKLKQLIQPFILRRTKSQVLSELPPRTEVLLHVEMNNEETAFYEALRQQALDNLNNFKIAAGRNGRHAAPGHNMQILAEITKLRRACCNVQLVTPGISIASSKLKLFSNIVRDLQEDNHKILVFSQFVGHLALIRKYLDQNGFSYRYLDGSTPVRERRKEVEGFQAGRGDLFLISLKAGGLGLNLTAADYVIHMDPWWNPAVEDQASDRAHRIGQIHPVTIYRLVTKNTIEEKIVKLHQQKRHLANSLLDGSDISARMSTEELFALIREQ